MRRVFPASEVPRCPVCGVHLHLCFCAGFPTFATRIRFRFVQHSQEARKPTNSARLACRILFEASIVPWSRGEPPTFPPGTFLLYPSAQAEPLTARELSDLAQDADGGPVTFAIPDGTWSQAGRIASELRKKSLPQRILPAGNSSTWGVRQSDDPERISSAQAAAMVLLLAGEAQAGSYLLGALAESSRRILAMRGVKAPV
ncbi:MAG TPA: tRNA-uridine aminocarboxypropyltransferase [Fibrobacteria bacterium]|nr:tRNA-uridine aminocarboxypropyltransferase [Fibrobacteria bacterium]